MKENTARLPVYATGVRDGCGLDECRRPRAGPAAAPAGGNGRRGGAPWTNARAAAGSRAATGVFAVIESCLKSCLTQ